MDFSDSPEDAAFRATARAWLQQAGSADRGSLDSLAWSKAWQAKKAAAGYAKITWPKEWGGPGGTQSQHVIFLEEESRYEIPPNPFLIGLGMCLPTIMRFADDETRKRFVRPALFGEEIWCQLFSEPSGGSDVAGARTRATRADDGSGDWIINGQKVWTTYAHLADFGMILCRTNPDVPKHKGLTMFWLDMRSPGVEVRRINQMSGESEFNEVFFSDVRIPDSQRLGEVDTGWQVCLVTLMNERFTGAGEMKELGWREFLSLCQTTMDETGAPLIGDRLLRQRLAEWYVNAEGLRHAHNRTLTALARGETPGPESSIGKLVTASQTQDIANAAVEMLGEFGIITDPDLAPLNAAFQHTLLDAPGKRIAGGTDEIMKNIIAERVLGLPGDIRVDKDVPFKDLKTGA